MLLQAKVRDFMLKFCVKLSVFAYIFSIVKQNLLMCD